MLMGSGWLLWEDVGTGNTLLAGIVFFFFFQFVPAFSSFLFHCFGVSLVLT